MESNKHPLARVTAGFDTCAYVNRPCYRECAAFQRQDHSEQGWCVRLAADAAVLEHDNVDDPSPKPVRTADDAALEQCMVDQLPDGWMILDTLAEVWGIRLDHAKSRAEYLTWVGLMEGQGSARERMVWRKTRSSG